MDGGEGQEVEVCKPGAFAWLRKKVEAFVTDKPKAAAWAKRMLSKNSTDKFHIDTPSYRALGALLGTAMVSDVRLPTSG